LPRGRNSAADALLNAVLDAASEPASSAESPPDEPAEPATATSRTSNPLLAWRDAAESPPTTIVLLRHCLTGDVQARRFRGSGGADPGLDDGGRDQAQVAARWLARRGGVDGIVTSPLRRARETADVIATALGLEVGLVEDLAEAAYGSWDGLSYAEVERRWPEDLTAWLEDTAAAPPGGESYDDVALRVRAALDELLAAYAGRSVLAVSHDTPIKLLVRVALDAPMHVVHHLQVTPGSLTTLAWWPDGASALRQLAVVPE
jgi:probable phosphoglycerate mutase